MAVREKERDNSQILLMACIELTTSLKAEAVFYFFV